MFFTTSSRLENHVMQLDNKEPCMSTKTDQLKQPDEKPDFWTQHSISNHVSLFSMLYGNREPSYRKLRESFNAVVPLTVTWLGLDGLSRKLSILVALKRKK
jgi:hypothetical protein